MPATAAWMSTGSAATASSSGVGGRRRGSWANEALAEATSRTKSNARMTVLRFTDSYFSGRPTSALPSAGPNALHHRETRRLPPGRNGGARHRGGDPAVRRRHPRRAAQGRDPRADLDRKSRPVYKVERWDLSGALDQLAAIKDRLRVALLTEDAT